MTHSDLLPSRARRTAIVLAMTTTLLLGASASPLERALAADADLEALKAEVDELRRRDEEQRRRIETLSGQVEMLLRERNADGTTTALTTTPTVDATSTPRAQGQVTSDIGSRGVGTANVRLIDISFATLFAAGFSTVDSESQLRDLEGGAHDPNNQGFTLQQAELSFSGAVDPYFSGEAHIVASTDGVELEEAFITTSALPYRLQLEMGYFFTEFGRINPQHPHQWDWMDQPVVNTRMFGGEGLRSPGFRLGWLTPLPWSSELHFGMQNADEEDLTASFISGEPMGGRPSTDRDVDGLAEILYLARSANSWELTPQTTALLGFSGLHGPNDTGRDGETWIYGGDFTIKWRPLSNFRGWPFVMWQTEIIHRDFEADSFPADALPSDELHDVGGYTQLVYGFRPGWATGLRFEYATGSGASVIDGVVESRSEDPSRADRFRFSPLLSWWPTHFSRLRFQYNLDWADQLDATEHTFWLGAEILYGAHVGHNF